MCMLVSGCTDSVQETARDRIVELLKKCVDQGDRLDDMNGIPYQTVLAMGKNAADILIDLHEDGTLQGVADDIAMYLVWDIHGETDHPLLDGCETAQQMYEAWITYMQK